MNYDELLKRAKARLPKVVVEKERFEMPKATGHIEGNKTIVSNFTQIYKSLQRDPAQILKYLQRELATPAHIVSNRLILGRKISAQQINQKIEQFAKDFVICPECGKPDTKLIKENRILFLRCTACGAKHSVKSKI